MKLLILITLLLCFSETTPKKHKNVQKELKQQVGQLSSQNRLKQQPSRYKTVLIAELFRHGARTTTKRDKINFPFTKRIGFGNLTGNGQRMHFLLGQQIRKNYSELFNTAKPPTNFDYLLYSSPLPRSLVSANSHLLGIYPPGKINGDTVSTSQTGEGLRFMSPPGNEIDVVFENKTSDSALPDGFRVFPVLSFQNIDYMFLHNGNKSCPGMGALNTKKGTERSQPREVEETGSVYVRETIKQVEAAGLSSFDIFGKPHWTLYLLNKLFDQSRGYLMYKGEHLPGMTDDLYTQLKLIYSWDFFKFDSTGSPKKPLFHTTTISEELLVNMNKKINGTNDKLKYLMFSGHDSTVYPFMMVHKLINTTCSKRMYEVYMTNKTLIESCQFSPEMAASFLWELNQDLADGRHYVRVLYNGQPVRFCEKNQDDFYCDFRDFEKEAKSRLILSDFMEICKGEKGISEELRFYKTISIALCAVIGFLTVFVVTLFVRLNRKKKRRVGVVDGFGTRLTAGQESVDNKNEFDGYHEAGDDGIQDKKE